MPPWLKLSAKPSFLVDWTLLFCLLTLDPTTQFAMFTVSVDLPLKRVFFADVKRKSACLFRKADIRWNHCGRPHRYCLAKRHSIFEGSIVHTRWSKSTFEQLVRKDLTQTFVAHPSHPRRKIALSLWLPPFWPNTPESGASHMVVSSDVCTKTSG